MTNTLNVVLTVTVLASGLGCTQPSGGQAFDFNRESDRVQRLTMSAGGHSLGRQPMVRTSMAIHQDWRVTIANPWTGYAKQVTQFLEPFYNCEALAGTRTECVRQLPGDLLYLELVAEPARAGLQVRISLEMRPD